MPENIHAVLASIGAEQSALRGLLRAANASAITQRPPSGEWSPLENVRHLLFAEQLHFRQFHSEKPPWSPLGLAPHFLAGEPPFKDVGGKATTDVEEVLRAWVDVHASTSALASSPNEKLREALDGNLKHLQFHVGIIESLLRGDVATET